MRTNLSASRLSSIKSISHCRVNRRLCLLPSIASTPVCAWRHYTHVLLISNLAARFKATHVSICPARNRMMKKRKLRTLTSRMVSWSSRSKSLMPKKEKRVLLSHHPVKRKQLRSVASGTRTTLLSTSFSMNRVN